MPRTIAPEASCIGDGIHRYSTTSLYNNGIFIFIFLGWKGAYLARRIKLDLVFVTI
jgi:hypothetical protein